mgnify:FL=1
MSEKIRFDLNPVTDGIVGETGNIESTGGKYVVIGTNFEHRIISEKEYCELVDQMQNVAMFIDDYIIVFDERKPIVVAGDTYLIGSFILMKMGEMPGEDERLTEDDVEEIKEFLSGCMTDLIIDGERHSALEIC